jgi:hypothetical protein
MSGLKNSAGEVVAAWKIGSANSLPYTNLNMCIEIAMHKMLITLFENPWYFTY